MTVKELITALLECPMDAQVQFGTMQGDYEVTGVLSAAKQSITLDYEKMVEAE